MKVMPAMAAVTHTIKNYSCFVTKSTAHPAVTTLNGGEYAFGNTEEPLRLENLGCAERGRKEDGNFNHNTARGWVRGRRGLYTDALVAKRNVVDLLLHDPLGGGFSPPASARMRALDRRAREGEIDRTKYHKTTQRSEGMYKSFHTQQISLGVVKADACATLRSMRLLSAKLARA